MNIVYTYVCGDILHSGHIAYLRNAKNLGDKLIVGVLTDDAIREEKTSPVTPFDERCNIIRSLEYVDLVIPQQKYSPIRNIYNIMPDIMVESESHSAELLRTVEMAVTNIKGRLVILPYWAGISSTKIKDQICNEK